MRKMNNCETCWLWRDVALVTVDGEKVWECDECQQIGQKPGARALVRAAQAYLSRGVEPARVLACIETMAKEMPGPEITGQ